MKLLPILLTGLLALGLSNTVNAQSTPTSTNGNMQSGSGATTTGALDQGSGMTRPSQSTSDVNRGAANTNNNARSTQMKDGKATKSKSSVHSGKGKVKAKM